MAIGNPVELILTPPGLPDKADDVNLQVGDTVTVRLDLTDFLKRDGTFDKIRLAKQLALLIDKMEQGSGVYNGKVRFDRTSWRPDYINLTAVLEFDVIKNPLPLIWIFASVIAYFVSRSIRDVRITTTTVRGVGEGAGTALKGFGIAMPLIGIAAVGAAVYFLRKKIA